MNKYEKQMFSKVHKLPDREYSVVDDMAIALIREKDSIIKRAITNKLGDNWSLEDLKGRIHSTKSPNTYEVYYLDGDAIVKFGGPVVQQNHSQPFEYNYKSTIQYQIL